MKFEVKIFVVKDVGVIDFDDVVFGIEEICVDLFQCCVKWQFVVCQQGMYKIKGCFEIVWMKKKFGCQKGGGGVCYGVCFVLIFVGGGCVYGLCVCFYVYDLLKKVCVLVLCYVLFFKVGFFNLIIIDDVVLKVLKIKDLCFFFVNLGVQNVLVIFGEMVDENFVLVVCNILCVDVLLVQGLNVYDVLCCDMLVLIKVVVEKIYDCLSVKEV